MKKIALIYMGGTFGCFGEPLAPMPEEQFLPQLQRILPLNQKIDCFKAPSVKDSSACTAVDWLNLVQYIQRLQQQDYQHFVVIHGTDTLSYAAAVLAQFLQQSCSVILTGSQYPLLNVHGDNTREFTDAIDNLNTALDQVLKVPVGVYLSFYHQVFHARTAIKVHSTALDAFRGLAFDHQLPMHEYTAIPIQLSHLQKAQNLNIINMMILPIEQQQFSQNLQNFSASPPHFLVLQAYGVGNLAVNDEIIALLQKLKQLGCIVILSSQVPFGEMDQRYAVSHWIQESQILVSDALSQADLYAKILKIYLQYPSSEQWYDHWYAQSE
ncbi:asparaginase [Acinetobacter silvestris]|nr:asparaginase [Acinetobacter silvestris]